MSSKNQAVVHHNQGQNVIIMRPSLGSTDEPRDCRRQSQENYVSLCSFFPTQDVILCMGMGSQCVIASMLVVWACLVGKTINLVVDSEDLIVNSV